MTRGLMVLGACAICLGLTSAVAAAPQVVGGRMVVTGSGNDYRLRVEALATNTGPIKCWRWSLGQGARVTAASRVDGWQLGLNQPAPAPIIGGRSEVGIAPGGFQEFRVLTDKPFDGNGSPGEGAISETCQSGSDVLLGMIFGSPPKPTPQPTPTACNCQNLTVVGSKYSSSQVNTGKAELNVNLNWTLTCSGPTGKCKGRIDISAPAGSDIQVVSPKNRKVTCNGRCLGSRTPSRGTTRLRATSVGDLYFDARTGKSFAFRLRLYCTRGGNEVLVGSKRMTFAFGSGGFLDKRKSDLNGNGVPDGKDKK